MDDRTDTNALTESERRTLDRHVRNYRTGTWPLPPNPWFTQELPIVRQSPDIPFTFHHTHRIVRHTPSISRLRRDFDRLWWHRINFLPTGYTRQVPPHLWELRRLHGLNACHLLRHASCMAHTYADTRDSHAYNGNIEYDYFLDTLRFYNADPSYPYSIYDNSQPYNENFEYVSNTFFYIISFPMNDVTTNVEFLQRQITNLTEHLEYVTNLPSEHPARTSNNIAVLLFTLDLQKRYTQWIHDSYLHFEQRMVDPARAATIPLLELPLEQLNYILDHLHPHDIHRLCLALVGVNEERYQPAKTLILEEYAILQRSTVNRWCTECYHCLNNTQLVPATWNRPSSARQTRRWDADAPSPQTIRSLQQFFAFQYYEGQERINFRSQIDGTFNDVAQRIAAFRLEHGATDPLTVTPPRFNLIPTYIPETDPAQMNTPHGSNHPGTN